MQTLSHVPGNFSGEKGIFCSYHISSILKSAEGYSCTVFPITKKYQKKKTTTQITDNHKNIRQCARLALLITVLCSVTINVIQFKFFSDSYLKWGNCGVTVGYLYMFEFKHGCNPTCLFHAASEWREREQCWKGKSRDWYVFFVTYMLLIILRSVRLDILYNRKRRCGYMNRI